MEKDEGCTSYDDVLEVVGNNGNFQYRFNIVYNLIFIVLVTMPCTNNILALEVPNHWCKVNGRHLTNYSIGQWKEYTIPKEVDAKGQESYSHCKMYNITAATYLMDNTSDYFDPVECQNGWEYDTTWYTETTVSRENWVCDKELYTTNSLVFSTLGTVFGSLVFGQLGDTIGRRPVFFLTLATLVVGRTLSVFTSSNYFVYSLASFVGGLGVNAVYQSPLVIAMEVSKDEDTAYIAMLQNVGYTAGFCSMPLIMWALGDWVLFTLVTTLPCGLFLFSQKYVVESPRWLAGQRKYSKCIKELEKIAKINGRTVPKDAILAIRQSYKTEEKSYGVMSLFSNWRMARNTVCLNMCWMITSLSYTTLTLNVNNIGGNPFLNFLYQGAAEFPSYVIGKYSCDIIGRRWTNMVAFATTFLAYIPLLYICADDDLQWLIIWLAVLVKFSISFALYAVNLQALEIYPTCVRQSGMSLGGITSYGIGILAPYIAYLGSAVDIRYPYIILLLVTTMAAICGFFLPETLYQKSPETLADAQVFGANQLYFGLPKKSKKLSDNKPVFV